MKTPWLTAAMPRGNAWRMTGIWSSTANQMVTVTSVLTRAARRMRVCDADVAAPATILLEEAEDERLTARGQQQKEGILLNKPLAAELHVVGDQEGEDQRDREGGDMGQDDQRVADRREQAQAWAGEPDLVPAFLWVCLFLAQAYFPSTVPTFSVAPQGTRWADHCGPQRDRDVIGTMEGRFSPRQARRLPRGTREKHRLPLFGRFRRLAGVLFFLGRRRAALGEREVLN